LERALARESDQTEAGISNSSTTFGARRERHQHKSHFLREESLDSALK
jgi:hypothetical protein